MQAVLWEQRFFKMLTVVREFVSEFRFGVRSGSLPLGLCFLWGALVNVALIMNWDVLLWRRLNLPVVQFSNIWWRAGYTLLFSLSGFWIWALAQIILKRRLLDELKDAFITAGLKSPTGKLPSFVLDKSIDENCRVLRLTRAGLPKSKFDDAKPAMESSLKIYVDEIREDRAGGTVDLLYAHAPLPSLVEFSNRVPQREGSFIVGQGRSALVTANLAEVPHLLVAGETNSGKSTFLRQFITTLYLNNKDVHLSLIDLKAGLELGMFANLDRIEVVGSLGAASSLLLSLEGELERRMDLFGKSKVKDIAAFNAKARESKRDAERDMSADKISTLGRHVVVIDEVSEVFLSGDGRSSKDVQKARAVISKLARQGRAVGLHVVLGTQRPDARALDTQIKANLPGKLCFQMADLHSSMVVLGNGRARELPCIAGRAVWQRGLELIEVQTPLLSPDEVESLLKPHRKEDKAPPTKTPKPNPTLSNHASPGNSPLDRAVKIARDENESASLPDGKP